MLNAIVWAMLTGLVTGGVWVAIVLRSHHQRLLQLQDDLLQQMESRLERLENVDQRLGEFEERLDFTERVRNLPSGQRSTET